MEKKAVEILRLTIITSRRKKDRLLSLLTRYNVHILTANYATGTVNANFLEELIGLIPEEEKIMMNCLIKKNQKAEIFQALRQDFHFDQPNTGIAFTAKVDQVIF